MELPRDPEGTPQGEPDPALEPAAAASSGPVVPEVPLDPREQERIRRAQAGDERAFEELVREHQQRAFRIARHLVPGDEDARDLVQEAFLRVFRSLERFDFQYSFATWLHRIVTNLAIDHLRRRRLVTQPTGGDDEEGASWESELESDAPSPSERMESNETARKVRECIAALAPHFQAVLTLRELEGLACTEIARIVGATHVTVRWRLHRGRKLFLEEWERRERAERSGAGRGPGAGPSPGPGQGNPNRTNGEGARAVPPPERTSETE